MFKLNDIVTINTNDGEGTHQLEGIVTRIWNKPASDPYVTVKTVDGRTFVRCASTTKAI